MNGFYRRYIRIDLTHQTFTIEPIAEQVLVRISAAKALRRIF